MYLGFSLFLKINPLELNLHSDPLFANCGYVLDQPYGGLQYPYPTVVWKNLIVNSYCSFRTKIGNLCFECAYYMYNDAFDGKYDVFDGILYYRRIKYG